MWFLAPSVALAEQQAQVLSDHLPAYRLRTLLGADGVEKWTDQGIWDALLANVSVMVSTPAVLADALSHGFLNMRRLSLCIFDEGMFHALWLNLLADLTYTSASCNQEPPIQCNPEALLPACKTERGTRATYTRLKCESGSELQERQSRVGLVSRESIRC